MTQPPRPEPVEGQIAGLLLAAGAGRRAGGPKALRFDGITSWLRRSLNVLRDGGGDPLVVVLGAEADRARAILTEAIATEDGRAPLVVIAEDWTGGMAASLRAGLLAIAELSPVPAAVVVHLVDLPDVTGPVVARVIDRARQRGPVSEQLVRATYGGRPGHPVLIGAAHLPALLPTLSGDRGASAYLLDHETYGVQCEDLATGTDRDDPQPA